MKNIPTLFLLFFLGTNPLSAQQSAETKLKIANAIAGYFEYDRETIHAHLDKSVFFSNEEIWFKGYSFNKMAGTPFFETTNVYALLLDESGNQIAEQLVFCYIGTFSGSFKLGPNFKSGRYYIRFYTNWMNNFREDESTAYPVDIINENERTVTVRDTLDYSKINVAFHPEGGRLVSGVTNNLGFRVTDCDGRAVENASAALVDADGKVVTNLSVGKNGCGKVAVVPARNLNLTVNVAGKQIDSQLPNAENGVALEVNNYALAGKTIVRLRCDASTAQRFAAKPLFVVIQQNNKSTIFETTLKPDGAEMIISNENLYDGVNTIRIVDSELNELAGRLICQIPENKQEFSFTPIKTADGLKIIGHSNFPNADVSLSVLPTKSRAVTSGDLYASFLINPYITGKIPDAAYYFDSPSKAKRYELDLFLLNQPTGKYQWRDMLSGQSKPTYDFDIGLTIKGTINQTLSDPKKYRALLSSPMALINDYASINEKNEFVYKNLIFDNVANFRFTLLENPSRAVDIKFFHQVINRKRPFTKAFDVPALPCSPGNTLEIDPPKFASDVIPLDNVEIVGKKKQN